ncbi:hypothetical protein K469DRAFT_564494 [Zopfia rhizophila CBS 207.26]|uniref:Cytoplasmic tRNA 2-thiolation protein 2 n=1 Tax=Zopfia rhizophila CBS 207.26 TaxID=1314779 RepID=A0A6A6EG73_9PEZI|nr:hypothetical protein K469DRAFT_564494 [Zopfia rhizophila CBS 207.26]
MTDQPCMRCKENAAALVVRTEPLCRKCFTKYVHTKVIKRMETFRVRNSAPDQQRKILLPISFGVSSVILLHVLDHHLKNQKAKTGRTGYVLIVLFVDTSSVECLAQRENLLSQCQERYPDHKYASAPLHDVFSIQSPEHKSLLGLVSEMDLEPEADRTATEQLSALMKSLTSATARADVISTLRTRLIVQYAKLTGCEGVLWGDSTTRLAEKTLAETAKGRGFSLPWQIADGASPFGVTFNYPLRDVLKKELVAYAELSEPTLLPLFNDSSSNTQQPSMSSKNTTIDNLMEQYFESVEENFPSIVSNVVRTTSRLEPSQGSASESRCKLCSMPVSDGRFGIHGWGGDQQDGLENLSAERSHGLCYGCTRSIPQAAASRNLSG